MIREQGLDAAYRPLLLIDALGGWITTPDWDASRAYLHDHLELLAEDVPTILESLSEDPYPQIVVHQALLALAKGRAGIDGAYEGITDEHELKALASAGNLRPRR